MSRFTDLVSGNSAPKEPVVPEPSLPLESVELPKESKVIDLDKKRRTRKSKSKSK